MAFHLSFQWAFEVLDLGQEIDRNDHSVPGVTASRPVPGGFSGMDRWGMKSRTLRTFFSVATVNLRHNIQWARARNQFQSVDFTEYDALGWSDIVDARNMQEHSDEYLQGKGRNMDRFRASGRTDGATFSADGTSSIGDMIGGRLDRKQVAAVVERLLAAMSKEPHPMPEWSMP